MLVSPPYLPTPRSPWKVYFFNVPFISCTLLNCTLRPLVHTSVYSCMPLVYLFSIFYFTSLVYSFSIPLYFTSCVYPVYPFSIPLVYSFSTLYFTPCILFHYTLYMLPFHTLHILLQALQYSLVYSCRGYLQKVTLQLMSFISKTAKRKSATPQSNHQVAATEEMSKCPKCGEPVYFGKYYTFLSPSLSLVLSLPFRSSLLPSP